MANTGFKFPTTTGFNVGGNPKNTWTNPTNGYAADDVYATRSDDIGSFEQSYGDFGFGIPATDIITGIIIKVQGKISTGSGVVQFTYGYDRTITGTNYVPVTQWSATESEDTKGSSVNNLGASTGAQMANGNFFFVVKAPGNNTGIIYQMDCVQVDVYHTPPSGLLVWFN